MSDRLGHMHNPHPPTPLRVMVQGKTNKQTLGVLILLAL